MSPRHTPDAAGYLVAVVIAMVITDLGFVISQGIALSPIELLLGLFWGMFDVLMLALPSAPVGVLIVHVVCRRVSDQRIHVAASALVGAAVGLVWLPVLSSIDGLRHLWSLPLLLAIACAIGRASMIPARPVDDDSPRGVPAC